MTLFVSPFKDDFLLQDAVLTRINEGRKSETFSSEAVG